MSTQEDQKIETEKLQLILATHKKWLTSGGKEGEKANLRKADLRGVDLRGVDFRGADFRGAKLTYADLQGADLCKAFLQEADLTAAKLQYAQLWDARLEGAYLIDADLRGATLWGARLQGADLGGADLREASLRGADIRGRALFLRRRSTNLAEANFEETNVTAIKFNRFASYRGIRVATCWGSPAFKRLAQDQDFIEELRSSFVGKILYWLWLILADCGRSFWPLLLWATAIVVFFGHIFAVSRLPHCLSFLPGSVQHPTVNLPDYESWFSPFYFSIVTLTTLGFGDVHPTNMAGEVWVSLEVVLGYLMLGLLISILGNKIARRA